MRNKQLRKSQPRLNKNDGCGKLEVWVFSFDAWPTSPEEISGLTAFNSPKLPHLAKWALRLALELPAATPHNALKTLEKLSKITLGALGNAGDRQSNIMAVSLNTSAASLYILHSGSREVPSLWAKRMVAIRPILSWITVRRRAAVGEAEASPTPTPTRSRWPVGHTSNVTVIDSE